MGSDQELEQAIRALWQRRSDRYSEERHCKADSLPRAEMAYLGG